MRPGIDYSRTMPARCRLLLDFRVLGDQLASD
ncbi:hypothetical protein NK6_591 [Bradyrhizobium diazoefficiens]|uniref:Uncharacterized protein n=1 Tax=Bradyrhizobium diazoefficiens TaxID=1355477 RepID=A0A0E4BKG3_9BRAD|nr:hypothetical protein NK6_591 [Bradyrhizobium diazoefficiens]